MSDRKNIFIDYDELIGKRQGHIVFLGWRSIWQQTSKKSTFHFTIQCDCGNTVERMLMGRGSIHKLKDCGRHCKYHMKPYRIRQRGEPLFKLTPEKAEVVLQFWEVIVKFAEHPQSKHLPFMVLEGIDGRMVMMLPDYIVVPHRIAVILMERGQDDILNHFRKKNKKFFLEN